MSEDNKFGVNEEICRFPHSGTDYIVVSENKKGDDTKIDMRIFYTDKLTEEIKPSTKGIRISKERMMEIMKLLNERYN